MEELKNLLEQQGVAFEEFKAANDTRLKAIEEKGFAPAEVTEKVDKANTDLTRLGKRIDDLTKEIQEIAKKANRPGAGGDDDAAVQAEHKSAFFSWARTGEKKGLRELEEKAMTVGADPGGGYLVGSEMEAGIDKLVVANTVLMELADVRTIGAASYTRRVRTSGAAYGWKGEKEVPSGTSTPGYAELEFKPGTIWAEPEVSSELLEDSEFDIESELTEALDEGFSTGVGEALIIGNGINKPRGLASYTAIANASYAWGTPGYIASGQAAALPGDMDAFIDVIHALKSAYRRNGVWLMNDATLASVRKYKDGDGNYMWQPSLQMNVPNLLLGYPTRTDDFMPDVEADALAICFGDYRRAYVVVRRRGMTMLRDPYTNKPYTNYYTTMRIGGGIKNFEALKFMKIAAS